jgi:hypothetical protein
VENDDLILFNIAERFGEVARQVVDEINEKRRNRVPPIDAEQEPIDLLIVNPIAYNIFGQPIEGFVGIETTSYDLRLDAEKAFNRLYDKAVLAQMEKEKQDGFDV